MDLNEKIKLDINNRNRWHQELNSAENEAKIQQFEKNMEEYRNRKIEYKSDDDFYDDIYYEIGCFSRTYHSNYSHGKKIRKSQIPGSVLPHIRSIDDFYSDKMRTLTERTKQLTEKINVIQ